MKLLLRKEGYSAFNPVFSPDGSKIFYLLADIGNSVKNGGHLRVINIEGSIDRLLLDGIFGSLAISPDGEKLILTTGDIFYDTSSIIIVDTSGIMVDTLQIEVSIKDVEFGKDINEIYYFRNGLGFYKYSFIDSSENLVLELNESFDELLGFDIKDDSLLFFKG
ncbi:MAG: TolB family protein, partial [bacterium]